MGLSSEQWVNGDTGIMYSNNDIFIKNEGDGRKQGVVRAIMNGWDDTSAHYDLS